MAQTKCYSRPLCHRVLVVLICCFSFVSASSPLSPYDNVKMRFLVTANTTSQSPFCMVTVLTPFLDSWRSLNETMPIALGDCDHGPLVFAVLNNEDGHRSKMDVIPTFYSNLLPYSVAPTCKIPWNGTYLAPTTQDVDSSPLPSCFTHVAQGNSSGSYWFRLLEWQL